MSEQDTSKEPQPTNTGRNSSEPAASSNKWDRKSVLLTLLAGLLPASSWVIYFYTGAERNDPKIHWLPISLMLTIIFVVIVFLWKKLWVFKNISQFNSWIFGVTIIGGAIAFLLPLGIANDFAKDSEGTTLRQILIYTTGGLLGVITLSETRRKNDLEKSKFIEQQIQFEKQLKSQKDTVELQLGSQEKTLKLQLESQEKNLELQLESQEKNLELQLKAQHDNLKLQLTSQEEKDKRDHTRQVHAERRSRYTKAVEQLANENAAVRLGGVYTLVGLVDEWLADSNIKEKEDRRKEGQVIINNLCSYIRSPFPLAEKIEEYKARKQLEELKKKDPKSLSPSDSWQLNRLNERFTDSNDDKKNKQIAADYAKIHEEQDVRRTIFVEMSKRSSDTIEEEGEVIETVPGPWSDFDFDFSRAPIFYPLNKLTVEQGNFASTRFYGKADFYDAVFVGFANFGFAKFTGNADFGETKFTRGAWFSEAEFTGDADFGETKFTGDTDFWGTEFTGDADFRNARFTGDTDFLNAEFTGDADFRNAKFTGTTKFEDTYFKNSAPTFADDTDPTRFSSQRDQKDYVFSANQNGKPIDCGIATLDGKSLEIPLGAILFDPSSGETSEPAEPLENSDTEEEKPAE